MTLGALALVAVASVVLLPNRGHDERPLSPDQYRKELVTAFAEVDLAADPTDGGALRDFADQVRDLAEKLGDIVPPADTAPMHARLVNGLDEYAGELDSFADSGREGVVALQQRLAETGGVLGQEWVQAFNELATRGYVTYEPH
jgi:hypothetical protein